MSAMNELNRHIHEILPKKKSKPEIKPDMMDTIENILKNFVENNVDDFLRCFISCNKIIRLIMAHTNLILETGIHSTGCIMMYSPEDSVILIDRIVGKSGR